MNLTNWIILFIVYLTNWIILFIVFSHAAFLLADVKLAEKFLKFVLWGYLVTFVLMVVYTLLVVYTLFTV